MGVIGMSHKISTPIWWSRGICSMKAFNVPSFVYCLTFTSYILVPLPQDTIGYAMLMVDNMQGLYHGNLPAVYSLSGLYQLSPIYLLATSLIHTDTDPSFTKNFPQPFGSITTFSCLLPQISIKILPACFLPISIDFSPADPFVNTTAQPESLFLPLPSLVQPMVLA